MNYSIEDWEDIFNKNNIIKLLEAELTYKEISGVLNKRGYECSPDSIRKAIKRLGYIKSEEQDLYYREHQKEYIKFMNSVDIEFKVETITAKRYYDCCFGDGYYYRENIECREVEIEKQILNEVEEVAKEFGCDSVEEYITCLILQDLDEEKYINKTNEFARKYLSESELFNQDERALILQKEKEGYNLYEMVVHGMENSILEDEKEFLKNISKEKEVDPYV